MVPPVALAHAEAGRTPHDFDAELDTGQELAVGARRHTVDRSDPRMPAAIQVDPCDDGDAVAMGLRFERPGLLGAQPESMGPRVRSSTPSIDDGGGTTFPPLQLSSEPAPLAAVLDPAIGANGYRASPACKRARHCCPAAQQHSAEADSGNRGCDRAHPMQRGPAARATDIPCLHQWPTPPWPWFLSRRLKTSQ